MPMPPLMQHHKTETEKRRFFGRVAETEKAVAAVVDQKSLLKLQLPEVPVLDVVADCLATCLLNAPVALHGQSLRTCAEKTNGAVGVR